MRIPSIEVEMKVASAKAGCTIITIIITIPGISFISFFLLLFSYFTFYCVALRFVG